MDSHTTSVRVAVRIRPPIPSPRDTISSPPPTPSSNHSSGGFWENQGGTSNVVVTASSNVSLNVMKASAPQPGIAAASAVAAEGHWDFDAVYGDEASQTTLFNSEVSPLISWFMEGFNVTLFAYGQTGSGKTYSMGTDPTPPRRLSASSTQTLLPDLDEDMGILPRALESIFAAIAKDEDSGDMRSGYQHGGEGWGWVAGESGVKEQITIREDKDGKLSVVGAAEVIVTTCEEAMRYLIAGSRTRTTASTAMNDRSSRSHAIFTLTLRSTRPRRTTAMISPTRRSKPYATITSKFHFVDLAGSERVIHALAEVGEGSSGTGMGVNGQFVGNVKVVPYRDSKLTRFLQDSLGGNSRTVMLSCISPSELDLPETISTLRYASRARGIKNRARVNVVVEPTAAMLASAAATEARLVGEVEELRGRLREALERAERAEREVGVLKGVERGESVETLVREERGGKEVDEEEEEDEEDGEGDEDVELFTRYARLRDHIRQLKGLVGSALAVGSGAKGVQVESTEGAKGGMCGVLEV
ncbi:P-loop containing nucleoside triphosphate hydrolase protein [Chytridium lagenaria]|nr:P-loop containing nucleoside triphosphate hydrolase protein [Chytridium lagenaria]